MAQEIILLVDNSTNRDLALTHTGADAASGGGFKTRLVGPTAPGMNTKGPAQTRACGIYTEDSLPLWSAPCADFRSKAAGSSILGGIPRPPCVPAGEDPFKEYSSCHP